MGKIIELPPELVKQIAAGEVIERPASVIKELVENSIDAGAKNIEIDIEQGGLALMRVRDDGSGIEKDDLQLAFRTHATSKIKDWQDLFKLQTLGFRGEALASIGSVAETEILSREISSESAFAITAQEQQIKPCSHPIGTTVIVKNIFYNIPARKRFLKSERTEKAHIIQLVERFALSNPQINFVLREKNKIILDIRGEIEQRITKIFGDNFLENSVFINHQDENINFKIWTSLPQYQSNKEQQFSFLNGRIIRDKVLIHAMKSAYDDLLHHGKQISYLMDLNLEPSLFDANAHPSKYEVRFRESGNLSALLISKVRYALRNATTPSFNLPSDNFPLVQNYSTSFKNNNLVSAKNIFPQDNNFSEKINHFSSPKSSDFFTAEALHSVANNSQEIFHDDGLGQALTHLEHIFLVAINKNGLVLVDIHAAHERIIYERFKNAWNYEALPQQQLLIPEYLRLGELLNSTAFEYRNYLENLGFFWREQGEELVLLSVPAILRKGASEIFVELLRELSAYENSNLLEQSVNAILSRMACHKAIRAHDSLSLPEMNQLLRDLEQTIAGNQCNHGRPTWVQLDIKALDNLFMRGR